MYPKGKLLIIGGAEDHGDLVHSSELPNTEFVHYGILLELLAESKKPGNHHHIEIITTGSRVQQDVKKRYKQTFTKLGCKTVKFIHINNRFEAHDKKYIHRISKASAVFFTGGDQFRLSTILGGTRIMDIIKKRYLHDPNFLVAGTSAGAMVMSTIMIIEGGIEEALINENLKTSSGIGLLQDCIIDTHFIKRGRFGRLAHAIIINPHLLGIGLGEDTALIIKKGVHAECRGSGMVIIIDGRHIKHSNISEVKSRQPIYVENLIVHLLVNGSKFNIKTRKIGYYNHNKES